MDQSIRSATNVFQTHRDIIVTNNFSQSDPLAWAKAMAACTVESIAFFDDRMRLILYNNKFRTLDSATQRDLADLYSLFQYYGRFYQNAERCLGVVEQVFLFRTAREFIMHNYSGWDCHCRTYPVTDMQLFRGVVLLADKHERGSALHFGEGIREQQQPTRT